MTPQQHIPQPATLHAISYYASQSHKKEQESSSGQSMMPPCRGLAAEISTSRSGKRVAAAGWHRLRGPAPSSRAYA
eukprot:CAMPEP_0183360136 /NCGR_PEP_ID=MMETSP0164_2-20130417/54410_1 /TAXON_ID=221442 /ORGANISM="Coccolithus pelagicus ssp braarudi, Strain PLY182g" /LENGTH=75 /DNA_ID=CAMNT_0025534425 /DNA_START=197 /DNA_END=424 /DNA_ORIENTATION=+